LKGNLQKFLVLGTFSLPNMINFFLFFFSLEEGAYLYPWGAVFQHYAQGARNPSYAPGKNYNRRF